MVAALAAVPAGVHAQGLVPELRLDGALGRDGWAQVGAGVFADAGLYARLGLVGGVGVGGRRDGGSAATARLEGLARFHFDPQRASRRGVYAGGGVGAAWPGTGAPRWALVALLGIEGPARRGRALALELGLGGGVRVGVALRRARADRR